LQKTRLRSLDRTGSFLHHDALFSRRLTCGSRGACGLVLFLRFMMAYRTACCCAGHAVTARNMATDAADNRALGAAFGVRCSVHESE
jgi:hypothetical protein